MASSAVQAIDDLRKRLHEGIREGCTFGTDGTPGDPMHRLPPWTSSGYPWRTPVPGGPVSGTTGVHIGVPVAGFPIVTARCGKKFQPRELTLEPHFRARRCQACERLAS